MCRYLIPFGRHNVLSNMREYKKKAEGKARENKPLNIMIS